MPADHGHLTRAEAACAELTATGQPITFSAVAVLARISRATLYRRADLRAIIDEHRTRGQDVSTLTSLNVQIRSEEHTSELQSLTNLVCRLLLERKNNKKYTNGL